MNGQVGRYILLNIYYLSKGADAGNALVCATPTVPHGSILACLPRVLWQILSCYE